jgi:pimeloyl-ACP methyl ester carboxylesterase
VRDAECIREVLSPGRPWSLLGQSFGGFCSLTYLSLFPRSLHEVYLTGGVAPIGRSADEVYRATYQRVADKNRAFFTRFPMPRPWPTGWPTTCTTTMCACPTASA